MALHEVHLSSYQEGLKKTTRSLQQPLKGRSFSSADRVIYWDADTRTMILLLLGLLPPVLSTHTIQRRLWDVLL
jgi:hypothetical protein